MEDILLALSEYEVVFWFFAGALCSQIFSKLLAMAHVAILLKDATGQILKMVGAAAEDVAFVKAMKYQALVEAGTDEEQVARVKSIDEHTFNNWKASLIMKLIANYPSNLRYTLTFYDWDGAMKTLDDIYKREARYERKK